MFGEMFSAVDSEYIPHLFITGCNIFPLHKTNLEKKQKYKDIEQKGFLEIVFRAIKKLLLYDLSLNATGTNLLQSGNKKLQELAEEGFKESYVAGYLTRLLSVSWYCLQETAIRGTLHRPINQLKSLLERYKDDDNIQRLIPMLDVLVASMTDNNQGVSSTPSPLRYWISESHPAAGTGHTSLVNASEADTLSTLAHLAFILYLKQNFAELRNILDRMKPLLKAKNPIGVTVTKLQVGVDYPLDYLTTQMVKKLKSNRLYVEPRVMYVHLNIQLALRESLLATEEGRKKLENLVKRLVHLVENASDREPYLGKLSYKHAEIILLQGYEEYFRYKCEEQHGKTIVMPEIVLESSLRKRDSATNFNLR